MLDPASLTELVVRHRRGDPEAARLLFAHYAQQLSHLAEQHLSRKLAGRVEGEDVVQSAFRTFFRRTSAGEFQIDSSAQLWRLLVKITVRKAQAQGRFHTAAARDVSVEHTIAADDEILGLVAREPSPEVATVLVDQIEVLLSGLPSIYCQILELRLQSVSANDIALRLGVSRRTVYRAIHLLAQRLEKMESETAL